MLGAIFSLALIPSAFAFSLSQNEPKALPFTPFMAKANSWLGANGRANLEKLTGENFKGGNAVELYVDGKEYYPIYLARLAQAENTIDMQTYLWCDDETGLSVANILSKKAKAGIRVRVVADWMNFKPHKKIYQMLKDSGVYLLEYNKLMQDDIQKRMHEKIAILDGHKVLAGGANFCNEYFIDKDDLKSEDEKKVGLKLWHDLVVEVIGPTASDYQRRFDDNWEAFAQFENIRATIPSTTERLGSYRRRREYKPVVATFAPTETGYQKDGTPNDGKTVLGDDLGLILWQQPYRWHSHAKAYTKAYVDLVNSAESEIVLFMPYFIPHKKLLKAIYKAAEKGVQVSVFTNSKETNDMGKALSESARLYYPELFKRGVRVYEIFTRGMHAKAMFIDRKILLVGSNNLTVRSLNKNGEQMLMTNSPAAIAKFQALVQHNIAHEYKEMTKDKLTLPKSWIKRLWARLIGPIF